MLCRLPSSSSASASASASAASAGWPTLATWSTTASSSASPLAALPLLVPVLAALPALPTAYTGCSLSTCTRRSTAACADWASQRARVIVTRARRMQGVLQGVCARRKAALRASLKTLRACVLARHRTPCRACDKRPVSPAVEKRRGGTEGRGKGRRGREGASKLTLQYYNVMVIRDVISIP